MDLMAHYPLTLTEDGDTILVTCPALPEVTTFGETRDEAIANGENAVMEALAARIDTGQHGLVASAADHDAGKLASHHPGGSSAHGERCTD